MSGDSKVKYFFRVSGYGTSGKSPSQPSLTYGYYLWDEGIFTTNFQDILATYTNYLAFDYTGPGKTGTIFEDDYIKYEWYMSGAHRARITFKKMCVRSDKTVLNPGDTLQDNGASPGIMGTYLFIL